MSERELAKTLLLETRNEEAEALVLHVIEQSEEQLGELHEDILSAKGLLACILSNQGKVDESRQLALQVTALTLKAVGDQHRDYISKVSALRSWWGVNPDGTEADEADESGSDWTDTDNPDPDGAEANNPEEPESNAASEQEDVNPDTALDEA